MTTFAVVADADRAFDFIRAFYAIGRSEHLKGLCLLRDGEPIAAVVYDDYNGQNVFMHVAAKPGRKWLNRHFLHEAFKHPFVTLGCGRITLWIEATNHDSIRFVTNLGFTREAVLEKAGRDGVDVVIYRMFRNECRYA